MTNYEPEPEEIFTAVKVDIPEMLLDILKTGVDINLRDLQGFTPLMKAVEWNRTEIINLLIDSGADIECQTQNYTPLMYAVQIGNFVATQLLLNKGANINARLDNGFTPLMLAIRDNYTNIVELLLSNNVDVNIKTKEGFTALIIAKHLDNKEIVTMIEKHLGIYDYGIPLELRSRLSVFESSEDLSGEKLLSIKQNIFPFAYQAILSPSHFRWHRHANSVHSSQALTIDVFGTIKMSKYKDEIINEICKKINKPINSDWNIDFEWQEPKNTLNESRPTDVDVHIQSGNTALVIECKFTEQDCGSCSQPNLIDEGRNKGITQCNGNYELQKNLVNGISNKCALSGKGIKYWDYIPTVYENIDNNIDYTPCPFKKGNYQWMRNLCLVEILKQQGIDSKFVVVYADSEYLSISKLVKSNAIFGNFIPKKDMVAYINFQELINIGTTLSENDINENEIWLELKSHFMNKLNKAKRN